METAARPNPAGRAAQSVALLRSERGVVRLALGVVALHIADDSFFRPEPGTSAGDHLVSGLVPIAVLAAVAWLYPLPRAGTRVALAMTFGALALAIGGPSVFYFAHGAAAGDHYTGVLALLAGAVLLAVGPVVLWRSRRPGGRRYLRRALKTLGALAVAVVLGWLVVFPIGFGYIYTHAGRTPSSPDLGVAVDQVVVTTSDGLDLEGWYVPSRNRAAIVVFPGASRAAEARMLIRHGYGVLLVEPRGQGRSEGDVVRWAGDRDLLAGAAYLQTRPDVDAQRIGAIGFSIGGENLLEAAAQSSVFRAVVSEGAGSRVGEVDEPDPAATPMLAVMTAAVTVFSNHRPPPPIVDRIGRIAPRSVFLMYADPGMGDENTRQPKYYAAAGEPKAIWRIPGSEHTGGIDAQPAEYERRVVGFFDQALLGT